MKIPLSRFGCQNYCWCVKYEIWAEHLGRILILYVGEDHVILSTEHKMRLGITLGLVGEPVSLDGCESVASNYTELKNHHL